MCPHSIPPPHLSHLNPALALPPSFLFARPSLSPHLLLFVLLLTLKSASDIDRISHLRLSAFYSPIISMATSPAGRMLSRQLQQMQSDKDIPGISCGLVDNNVFEWEVMLMISDDVKLYGGMS